MMSNPNKSSQRGSGLAAEAIIGLTMDSDPFLSCDDCFDQVDAAVESLISENVPLTEELGVHLKSCGVCHDEALSLAELIAADFGLSPVDAIVRIEAAVSVAVGAGRD